MRDVGDRRAEPLLRQPLHHVDEAAVDLADDGCASGTRTSVEEQLGGVGLGLTDLVELAAAGEARHAGLDAEQRDALGALARRRCAPRRRPGRREYPLVMKVFDPLSTQSSPSRTAVVFSAARSEPPLGSVIAIAVTSSPVQKPGQPALLLLLGAQVAQVGRDDVGVDAQARRHRGRDARQLLAEHGVEPVVAGLGAAVLLGDLQAEEALLARLDPDVARDRLGLDELLEPRPDLAVERTRARRRGTPRGPRCRCVRFTAGPSGFGVRRQRGYWRVTPRSERYPLDPSRARDAALRRGRRRTPRGRRRSA